MSSGRGIPKILETIKKESPNEVMADFLVSVLVLEHMNPGLWKFTEVYERKINESLKKIGGTSNEN